MVRSPQHTDRKLGPKLPRRKTSHRHPPLPTHVVDSFSFWPPISLPFHLPHLHLHRKRPSHKPHFTLQIPHPHRPHHIRSPRRPSLHSRNLNLRPSSPKSNSSPRRNPPIRSKRPPHNHMHAHPIYPPTR